MKNIWLFNADSYQEVSIDWLTAIPKHDNHGGVASNVALTQGSWDEVLIGLLRNIGATNWT